MLTGRNYYLHNETILASSIIASLSILRQMAKLSRPFLDDHPDQARLLLRQLCAFLTRQNEPHVQLLAIQLLVRWLERANNELIMASIEDNGTIVALLAASFATFDHHGTCFNHFKKFLTRRRLKSSFNCPRPGVVRRWAR